MNFTRNVVSSELSLNFSAEDLSEKLIQTLVESGFSLAAQETFTAPPQDTYDAASGVDIPLAADTIVMLERRLRSLRRAQQDLDYALYLSRIDSMFTAERLQYFKAQEGR